MHWLTRANFDCLTALMTTTGHEIFGNHWKDTNSDSSQERGCYDCCLRKIARRGGGYVETPRTLATDFFQVKLSNTQCLAFRCWFLPAYRYYRLLQGSQQSVQAYRLISSVTTGEHSRWALFNFCWMCLTPLTRSRPGSSTEARDETTRAQESGINAWNNFNNIAVFADECTARSRLESNAAAAQSRSRPGALHITSKV